MHTHNAVRLVPLGRTVMVADGVEAEWGCWEAAEGQSGVVGVQAGGGGSLDKRLKWTGLLSSAYLPPHYLVSLALSVFSLSSR